MERRTALEIERLSSVEDVAEFLGVPVKTLHLWRTKHYGPKGKRIGRYVRYRPEDVRTWLDSVEEFVS